MNADADYVLALGDLGRIAIVGSYPSELKRRVLDECLIGFEYERRNPALAGFVDAVTDELNVFAGQSPAFRLRLPQDAPERDVGD